MQMGFKQIFFVMNLNKTINAHKLSNTRKRTRKIKMRNEISGARLKNFIIIICESVILFLYLLCKLKLFLTINDLF